MSKRLFAILGAGNMAEGILAGALERRVLHPDEVRVGSPGLPRRKVFAEKFGVHATPDNTQALAGADVVLLSIKPQIFHAEAPALARAISGDCLVISIMAGVRCETIVGVLGDRARVIRAMPNLPIRVGAGVTGLYRGRLATDADLTFAMELFEAGGKAVSLANEDLLDAVTAVSGSGPAHFYYIVEALAEAGQELGLSREQALALAQQTCLGAGRMMVESGQDPALLREKVSSKGGTTLAALDSMENDDLKDRIKAAVRRTFERARQLAAGDARP